MASRVDSGHAPSPVRARLATSVRCCSSATWYTRRPCPRMMQRARRSELTSVASWRGKERSRGDVGSPAPAATDWRLRSAVRAVPAPPTRTSTMARLASGHGAGGLGFGRSTYVHRGGVERRCCCAVCNAAEPLRGDPRWPACCNRSRVASVFVGGRAVSPCRVALLLCRLSAPPRRARAAATTVTPRRRGASPPLQCPTRARRRPAGDLGDAASSVVDHGGARSPRSSRRGRDRAPRWPAHRPRCRLHTFEPNGAAPWPLRGRPPDRQRSLDPRAAADDGARNAPPARRGRRW
jgi:hypothetical protein